MTTDQHYIDRLGLVRAERDALMAHAMKMSRHVAALRSEWQEALNDHSAQAASNWALLDAACVLWEQWIALVRAEIKADIAADVYAREAACRTTDALAEMFRVATAGPAGQLIAAELERRYPQIPAEQRVFAEPGMSPSDYAMASIEGG